MLYKKLTFVSFIASIFSPIRYANAQSSYTVGSSDVTCAAGLETCTITCNQGSDFSGNINCNDAKNCVFDCVAEKCTLDARINAQNAQTLTITSSGFQCMKWSQIDAGNAESVTIRCTGDMCMKNSYINARNAQFLRIEVPTGGDFGQAGKSSETYNDMYVDCPRGGSAAGTYAAPCVLEVTGSGTLGGGVHVITGGGVPRDFQLIGGVSTEVYVACNGYSPATPFDTYDQGDTSVYDQLSDITGSGHSCYAAPTVAPTTAAPTTKTPTTATPTTASPTTATPTTADPTTADPTTANPTTTAPTTAAPTTVAPTSASPTSAAPTTANPTTGLPTKGPTPPPVEDEDQDQEVDDDDDQGGDGDGDQQNVDETPAEEDAGPLVSFLPGNQFEQLIMFCALALICTCCCAALCLSRLCAKHKRALAHANMASLSEFSQAPTASSNAAAAKNRSVPMQALRSVSSMSDDDGDRDKRRDTVQAYEEDGEQEPASVPAAVAGSPSSQSENAKVAVVVAGGGGRPVPPPPMAVHPPRAQPPAVPMDAAVGMAAMQMPAAGMMGGMGGMAPGMMSVSMPMMNMAAMMQQTNMMSSMPGMMGGMPGMPSSSNMMFGGGGGEQGGDVGGELPLPAQPQVRAEEDIETHGADDDNDDQYDPQPGVTRNGHLSGALPPHDEDEEMYEPSPVNNDQPLAASQRTNAGYEDQAIKW